MTTGNFRILLLLPIALGLTITVFAAKDKNPPAGNRHKQKNNSQTIYPAETQKTKNLSIILSCPSDVSVIVTVLSADNLVACVEYGNSAGAYQTKTKPIDIPAEKPAQIPITNLKPDTQYFYRLNYRKSSDGSNAASPEYRFHTQRPPGRDFAFVVQGDSHPERDNQNNPKLYARSLLTAAESQPDFFIMLGDDFSVDTLQTLNAQSVANRYALQRPFLALVGSSAPVFLVNGNHEQAARYNLNATPNNVAVWAQNARNAYYPQPEPDRFYSGDDETVQYIGRLKDYYAWTWGDAIFVVLDPYWHSTTPVDNVLGGGEKRKNLWDVTLGDSQYQWFKQTLEKSSAKYKFVFAHHVLGTGRGGIELATQFEWGGKNKKGVWEFDQKRPAWELPIHQLMAKNNVTLFFQGHDHLFARQQLDGVTYQTVPEPADPRYSLYNDQAYLSGDKLPNSGFIKVAVSPDQLKIDYIRCYLDQDLTDQQKNGQIAFSYTIKK